MPNFKIFTESKADVKFLKDFIEQVFAIPISEEDFDTLGGWSGYKNDGKIKTSIRENTIDNERTSILVLDADVDFDLRRKEIINDFTENNIPIQLFLFPNNGSPGALETMLTEIVVDRKIITCFEAYESCIKGYQAPVTKSKVFAYLDALLPEKNKKNDKNDLIQDKNRNFRNTDQWNLNHEFLNTLKEFLAQHIL